MCELIEPEALEPIVKNNSGIIVDVCDYSRYAKAHIPSALHLQPQETFGPYPHKIGDLPNLTKIKEIIIKLGIIKHKPVYIYDDIGGVLASRLIWLLDCVGYHNWILINGGLISWLKEGRAYKSTSSIDKTQEKKEIELKLKSLADEYNFTKNQIISTLHSNDIIFWDSRSKGEFTGETKKAAKAGHIPGSIHLDYRDLLNPNENLRIRSNVSDILEQNKIDPSKQIITYCHSNQRSAFAFVVGRLLKFERIKCYGGSWSEWGNSENSVVSIGEE